MLNSEFIWIFGDSFNLANSKSKMPVSSCWCPSPIGLLKCNVDATFPLEKKIGAI